MCTLERPFTFIPLELLPYLFSFLSSQDRSIVCSVSQLFCKHAIDVSKSLSLVSQFYDGIQLSSAKADDNRRSSNACIGGTENQLKASIIEKILMSGDYHLIVRLKNRKLINLQIACRGGHLQVVQLMIEKGENQWNMGLREACQGGHISIIELMIEKGANNWNEGLRGACKGGHISIVELMIQKGGPEYIFAWGTGLLGACLYGHLPIVKLMIQKGEGQYNIDWDEGFSLACQGGHLSVIELLINPSSHLCKKGFSPKDVIKKGADAWNLGLMRACQFGHLPVAELMIQKGGPNYDFDWNMGLYWACIRGHPPLVNLMIEKGASKCSCGKSFTKHK